MVAKPASPSRSSGGPAPSSRRFKGVRMRSWGKWVSEIRLPNTRARLWLGSFSTAEQAARAFDVAVVCLRGRSTALNFPDSPPPYAPLGLPHHQIQALAAAAAASASTPPPSSSPPPSPIPCQDVRTPPQESEPAIASSPSGSEQSGNATVNYRSSESVNAIANETVNYRSSESVDAIANETASSSSSSCSSSYSRSASCSSNDSATFADLLELEAESEQSSPLDAALQERSLNMGVEWDELLWGLSIPAYTPAWDEQLLLLPPPFFTEDDLPISIEQSLWCL